MYPWLLKSPPVPAYGVCVLLALVVGWFWARRRAGAVGISPSRVDLLVPLVTAGGLLGAWVFGRLSDMATGVSAQGAVLVGSLLVGTGVGIGYAVWSGMALGVLGDITAPPVALGIAIGRVGCFLAGCCYGKPCAVEGLGVRFGAWSPAWAQQVASGALSPMELRSLAVYPVQLYEAAGCALLAVILWRWRPRIAGERFLVLGLGYAALRFALEFLRGDNPAVIGGLTFSAATALVMAAAATATWALRRRYARAWRLEAGR